MVRTTSECTDLLNERRHLARMRCLQECATALKSGKPLPKALAYCPEKLEYRFEKSSKLIIYEQPSKSSATIAEIPSSGEHVISLSGEEFTNDEGLWARFIGARAGEDEIKLRKGLDGERWVLLYSTSPGSANNLVRCAPMISHAKHDDRFNIANLGKECRVKNTIDHWIDVIEHEYSMRLVEDCVSAPSDPQAVVSLLGTPVGWSLDDDEELAVFLSKAQTTGGVAGDLKEYVEKLEVSTSQSQNYESCLSDNDPTTYWESDGNGGRHWIRLHIRPGVIIKRLWMTVADSDRSYMPHIVQVLGGPHAHGTAKLNEVYIDQTSQDVADVLLLSDQVQHYRIIDICVKECKDHGIDTRVHGIKMRSSRDFEIGINRQLFSKASLVRYPKLQGHDLDYLYRRALLLDRLIRLLDSVLQYIIPSWEFSLNECLIVKDLKPLLPLSKRRMLLADQFLCKTQLTGGTIPVLYINRHAAFEHRSNPSSDPEYKKSIFNQIYEGLKPKDSSKPPIHYRWGVQHEQWWECKFIKEGVVDQGGGFRDSISDLSEELCPSNQDQPTPIPFFIRSPNQRNEDASANRDLYVVNPSCSDLHKYIWIGKLMGACLRGKEFLILAVPEIFWKQLIGQSVSWQNDFTSVDEYQVQSLEQLMKMDEETFNVYYEDRPLSWSCVLSDGTTKLLRCDGETERVKYSDREQYVQQVKEARLTESEKQIKAIREGLLQVVPQAVLDLFTPQELEHRVCGDPEITVTSLKKYVKFEEGDTDPRIKYFWTAVENFTSEERSRLLRFVTGRRRLPTNVTVYWSDTSQDSLPTSSTCGSTLFLPSYTNAKQMEDKLRYAMYNCISIDTDTSPLDDF